MLRQVGNYSVTVALSGGCYDKAAGHPVLVTGKDTSHLYSWFPLVWFEG